MDINFYFFQPAYFYSLQIVLFIVFLITLFSLVRRHRKLIENKEVQMERNKMRIAELEGIVNQKEQMCKEKIAQSENAVRDKVQEFKSKISILEAQLQDNELLKSNVSQLQAHIREKEELLRKETFLKNELNEKIKSYEEELAKLNKDLSLSNQMYEGLKGQYNEFEEKFSQLFQQFLEEQKKNKLLQQLQKSTLTPENHLVQSQLKEQTQPKTEDKPIIQSKLPQVPNSQQSEDAEEQPK